MSDQKPTKDSIHKMVEALRHERDEIGLKIKWGKMELRDEWHQTEQRWQKFERMVDDTSDDARQSLHELGRDLAGTYKRLKSKLH